tara:strand:+ start:136 stop:408 length:273 start_codon:yes stop_codon:yes gene_type:complete
MTNNIYNCECCGKEEEVLVCSAPFGACSIGRCKNCFENDYYPYHLIVANTWGIGGLENGANWYKELVVHSLKFYKKTEEDLEKDMGDFDE